MASTTEMNTETRRDFLYVATAASGAVFAGSAVIPLVGSMNPSADVLAQASTEVDLSGLEVGAQMIVEWRGKPTFVRRRAPEEIAAAREVSMSALPDQDARNANAEIGADARDENRSFGETGEWLIIGGNCTHLGCVPVSQAGDYNGWYCPCHGSHYDTSGRIRRGPAPENLPVPPLAFEGETTLIIG